MSSLPPGCPNPWVNILGYSVKHNIQILEGFTVPRIRQRVCPAFRLRSAPQARIRDFANTHLAWETLCISPCLTVLGVPWGEVRGRVSFVAVWV